jgi:hypothetical protein
LVKKSGLNMQLGISPVPWEMALELSKHGEAVGRVAGSIKKLITAGGQLQTARF